MNSFLDNLHTYDYLHSMKRHFITNGSVKIEVTEWKGQNPSLAPVLFIPGMFGTAESFRKDIESHWSDRNCYSMSLRGRGQSDAPESGYQLADHVSDIAALVRQFGLKDLVIVAYSRGVTYALGFAKTHPSLVRGLALLDHPPFHLPIDAKWAEKWTAETSPMTPVPEVVRALQREADFVDLSNVLKELNCAVLLVAGGAEGSMLNRDDLIEFGQGVRNLTTHVEDKSGHELETLKLREIFEPLLLM